MNDWTPSHASELKALVDHPPNHYRQPKQKLAFYSNGLAVCPRRDFYQFKGVNADPEFVKSEFPLGRAVGDMMVAKFQRAGFTVETEVGIGRENPSIHGYIDMLVYHPKTQNWYPVEIKSVKSDFALEQGMARQYQSHIDQLLSYIHIGQYVSGYLLYVSRATGKWDLLYQPRDFKRWQEILDYCIFTTKDVENNRLPDRPFQTPDRVCEYCPFKRRCWE